MARDTNSIRGISILAVLVSLFLLSGISRVFADQVAASDWPLLDSRYENHTWEDQYARCVIWHSGLVTTYDRTDSPAVGGRLASGNVIAELSSAELDTIHELIKLAARGHITDPERTAIDAGISAFSAWVFVDYTPMFAPLLLMQWGDESRINTSGAASELVELMVEVFKETDCPGAEFGSPEGSSLDSRSDTATSFAMEDSRSVVQAPFGEYRIVALRSASDVESTPTADADIDDWIGRTVSFGETLQWINGSSCNNWFARKAEQPLLDLADPNLSDLGIEPLSPPAYHVFASAQAIDLYCNDNGLRPVGSLIWIDDRILVTHSPSGSTNVILEKPLSSRQVGRLQEQLKDMKFYHGEITGELDEATLRSVGFYAEYRGSEFRFFRTAITENLLDGLGVLDEKLSGQ